MYNQQNIIKTIPKGSQQLSQCPYGCLAYTKKHKIHEQTPKRKSQKQTQKDHRNNYWANPRKVQQKYRKRTGNNYIEKNTEINEHTETNNKIT